MLKNPYRITKNKDFEALFKKSRFFNNRLFLLRWAKNGLKNSRFGFIASLKVSKKAVDRNRAKRLAREAVRLNFNNIKPGYDLVFILKKESVGADYAEMERNILGSLKSANLI